MTIGIGFGDTSTREPDCTAWEVKHTQKWQSLFRFSSLHTPTSVDGLTGVFAITPTPPTTSVLIIRRVYERSHGRRNPGDLVKYLLRPSS